MPSPSAFIMGAECGEIRWSAHPKMGGFLNH